MDLTDNLMVENRKLKTKISDLETALWAKDEGLLERDKKVAIHTAKTCAEIAEKFVREYSDYRSGACSEVAKRIRTAFSI